jgi:hypothetical protein
MTSFLETRWNGEAPLEMVFWRDMLLVGTAINVASAAAGFALLSADYPRVLALLLHMLPVPWNLFLIVAVWRSADREGGPPAVTAKVIGVMWLMTMFVL